MFAKDNSLLALYLPAFEKFLVYKVRKVRNGIYRRINYGLLPLDAGETVNVFSDEGGGTTTTPDVGCLPAYTYVTDLTFPPLKNANLFYDPSDMFYYPVDVKDMLVHYVLRLTPDWLRITANIPKGVSQVRMHNGRIHLAVDSPYGWVRGGMEIVQLPGVHYGFNIANDSNMPVYVKVVFDYCEYEVEVVREAKTIIDVKEGKVKAVWVTLPMYVPDERVRLTLENAYGFDGIPITVKTVEEVREVVGG